jgi:hypothetical protein
VWKTEFKALWKGFPKEDATWEPLENLADCAGYIFDFMKKKAKAYWGKSAPTARRLAPPRKVVLNFFRCRKGLWYIPEGVEFVKRIYYETTVGKNKYLMVKFRPMQEGRKVKVVFVPRCLMDYYFPTEVAMFLKANSTI